MTEATETFQVNTVTVKIIHDEDAQSPAENGNKNLFLVADHRDFFVPPSRKERNCDVQSVIDEHAKTHWIWPLEAYIHGGVILAIGDCGNFPDRQWDVSRLGAVFVSKEEWPNKVKAAKAALALVAEWNTYLSGDVYGYVIEDIDGNNLDSRWGFYGFKYCKEEATSAAQHYAEKQQKLAVETEMACCYP